VVGSSIGGVGSSIGGRELNRWCRELIRWCVGSECIWPFGKLDGQNSKEFQNFPKVFSEFQKWSRPKK